MGHVCFLIAETEKLLFNMPSEVQLSSCCPGLCGVLKGTQNKEATVPFLSKFFIFEKNMELIYTGSPLRRWIILWYKFTDKWKSYCCVWAGPDTNSILLDQSYPGIKNGNTMSLPSVSTQAYHQESCLRKAVRFMLAPNLHQHWVSGSKYLNFFIIFSVGYS